MKTPCHQKESFSIWQPTFSIGFVLVAYLLVYVWTAPSSTDGRQQPVFVEESRHRELGVVLRDVTDPDRTAIVPEEAIQRDQAGKFVFVRSVKRQNMLVRHSVITERLRDGQIRILHGLHAGEQLVVSGAERLRAEPDIHSKTSENLKTTRLRSQSGSEASKK